MKIVLQLSFKILYNSCDLYNTSNRPLKLHVMTMYSVPWFSGIFFTVWCVNSGTT